MDQAPSTCAPMQPSRSATHGNNGASTDWSTTATAEECQTSCSRSATCAVWTWHDSSSFGDDWAHRCVMWSEATAEHHGRSNPDSWLEREGATSGTCEADTSSDGLLDISTSAECQSAAESLGLQGTEEM